MLFHRAIDGWNDPTGSFQCCLKVFAQMAGLARNRGVPELDAVLEVNS